MWGLRGLTVFSQKLYHRQRRVKRSCHDGEIDPQIPLLRFFSLWNDPNEIPNKLATLQIVIILFPRTNSFTLSTFLSPSVPHLHQRSHHFWTWKATWKLGFFPFYVLHKLFSTGRPFSNIFPQFEVKLLWHAVVLSLCVCQNCKCYNTHLYLKQYITQ